jgi:mono/diheme cytochrome c family protein
MHGIWVPQPRTVLRRLPTLLVLLQTIAIPVALGEQQPAAGPAVNHAAAGRATLFTKAVRPFLDRHCTECHGGKKPKAGVNLAAIDNESEAIKNRLLWSKVKENVDGGLMPPEGRRQPTREEVDALTKWIETELDPADCGRSIDPGKVTIRRLNRAEYNNTIRDLLGIDSRPADDFPSDDVGYGFDNIGDVLTIPPILMEKYLAAAESIAGKAILADEGLPASKRRIVFRTPTRPEEFAECASDVLQRFAARAYRRPVSGGELSRLMRLVDLARENGDTFQRGIQVAVQAALVSPQFLFRVELNRGGRKRKGGKSAEQTLRVPLGQFEIASRLSYFLWSSMPDDELFKLASEGKLNTAENLARQAHRMLRDAKSQALVDGFAAQWLQLRSLRNVNPDRAQFPDFDESLRSAMQQETEHFFTSVMREDRSILDFLDCDETFLNERLARHYGIAGVTGDTFRRVRLQDRHRGGLITQASILTVTSNPTRTSPVKRGKWVLEQILGTPPPAPPPNVPKLDDDKKSALLGTLRQRMEQHISNPSCASCHSRLDPPGFGLENYDAIGAWRDKEGAHQVDASGKLPTGESFRGPDVLKVILKSRKREFTRCLAEKLFTYALGRGVEEFDTCTIDKIADAVAADQYRFERLIMEVVTSDAFLKRRG